MKFCSSADNNIERERGQARGQISKAKRREEKMSALHQVVPMFLLIQFVVVLVAIVAAMLLADPQYSLPAQRASRRPVARS
jgi:hypothetical protein